MVINNGSVDRKYLFRERIEVIYGEISRIEENLAMLDDLEKSLRKEIARAMVLKEFLAASNKNNPGKNGSKIQEMNNSISELQRRLDKAAEENNGHREQLLKEKDLYTGMLKEMQGSDAESNSQEQKKDFFGELIEKNPELLKKIKPILENYDKLGINIPGINIP